MLSKVRETFEVISCLDSSFAPSLSHLLLSAVVFLVSLPPVFLTLSIVHAHHDQIYLCRTSYSLRWGFEDWEKRGEVQRRAKRCGTRKQLEFCCQIQADMNAEATEDINKEEEANNSFLFQLLVRLSNYLFLKYFKICHGAAHLRLDLNFALIATLRERFVCVFFCVFVCMSSNCAFLSHPVMFFCWW